MISLEQFIKTAEKIKTSEKDKCKKWLYKQIRMQLNKDTVTIKKNWKIHLASTGVSLINRDDNQPSRHLDCNHKIIKAINDIKECSDILENEIKRIEPDCSIDVKNLLKKIEENLKKNSRGIMAPSISINLFKKSWDEFLNGKADESIKEFKYPKIETLDIDGIIEELKKLSDSSHSLLNVLIKNESSIDDIRDLLKKYEYKEEDLPREDDIYSRCLGKYSARDEKITIYLNTIYDSAKIKGIDPIILFRKVLIHEMAHCLHHIGIDGDDKIWDDFGYKTYGKNTIEGLAQWYTYRYMYHFDKEIKNPVPMNLLVMLWFSNFQPAPYKHFKTWHKYNYENINRVLVEARKHQNLKEHTGSKFDAALKENYDNKKV